MKKLLPYWAFFAVAVASILTAVYAYRAGEEATRFKFEAAADDALGRIESRIDLDLSLLVTTRAFLEAKRESLTHVEFERFFEALSVDRNFLGLRGIGYLSLIRADDDPAAIAQEGEVTVAPDQVFPASDNETKAAVALFQPMDTPNTHVIGYDMYTDAARRQAIDAAIATGELHATGAVILGQATGAAEPRPGLLVFAAVKPDPDDSRSPGLAYMAFRTTDLFEAALIQSPILPVSVRVTDDTEKAAETMLFRSPDRQAGPSLTVTRRLEMAGRSWRLEFAPTSAFEVPNSRLLPWLLGLAGMMLALAVAALARYQQRAYEAKSRLHEASEKNLLERELMLQEMKHRIKNSIARILAMARQTAAHSADLKQFSSSFGARLQSMAASQDLLTRSRGHKADLKDLLVMELGQVFGTTLPDGVVVGKSVELDETAAHAIGLTFHELATNALKYGAVATSANALAVRWHVETADGLRQLRLVWSENGSRMQTPVRKGFGTKLIEMSINRELGGTIDRAFGDDGYVVTLTVPLNQSKSPA